MKTHALMTGQPTEAARLPEVHKDLLAEPLAGTPATVELRTPLWFNSATSTGRTLDMRRDLSV